jgi:hypothetical protein
MRPPPSKNGLWLYVAAFGLASVVALIAMDNPPKSATEAVFNFLGGGILGAIIYRLTNRK